MTEKEEQTFREHIRFLLRQNDGGINPQPGDFRGSEWLRTKLDLSTIQRLYAEEIQLVEGGQ